MQPIRFVAVAGLAMLASTTASAQTVGVSGNPGLLRVSTAVAGSEPIAVSNSSTTYTVTTPQANRLYKIIARLSAPMPVGPVILWPEKQ